MISRTILLSDIHMSADRPDISARMMDFLQNETNDAEQLFFLGDLFDYWVGDDLALNGMDPVAESLATSLRKLSDHGVKIFFMPGNRDFLLGEAFAQHCGMQLLKDPTTINLYGRKLLLAHGDAWCTDDHEYQTFRHMVRNTEWQQSFIAQPIEERLAQAAQARAASQTHTSNSSMEIMDVNQSQIDQAFLQHQVNLIIHGHTHRPADHHYANGNIRMVLGDWYEQSSWLSIDQYGMTRQGKILC